MNVLYSIKNVKGALLKKKCWIAKYIELGGKNNFEVLKV